MASTKRLFKDQNIKLHFKTNKIENLNFPLLNYTNHPGFCFAKYDKKFNKEIDNILKSINIETYKTLQNFSSQKNISSKKKINIDFKNIDDLINDLLAIINKFQKINEENIELYSIINLVKNAIIKSKKQLKDEINYLINEEFPKGKFLKSKTYSDIKKYGFSLYKIEENIINKLKIFFKDDLYTLKKNASQIPGPRKIIFYNLRKNYFKFRKIKKIVKDTILYYELKKIFPKIDILSIGLEYSYPNSNWYKNCYSDIKMKTSKGSYFHVDYEYDIYKSTIFLNEIKSNNGPFSYIPGSNKMPRNKFLFRYFKELDIELKNYFNALIKSKNLDFGNKKYYYRKQFISKDFREKLSFIPYQLFGSSHFGDDLLSSDLFHDLLQKNEFKVTSDIANAVTFNGHDGIHRGGLVKKGERIVMFITWCNKKSIALRIILKIRSIFLRKLNL